MSQIRYVEKVLSPPDFRLDDHQYFLDNCTSEENLILPDGTEIDEGKYKNLFVGIMFGDLRGHKNYTDVHIADASVDCIRIGPYGRLYLNDFRNRHGLVFINRLITESKIQECVDVAIESLHVLEGAIVHLNQCVRIDEIVIDRGTVYVHDPRTINFTKMINLKPGGIIKFLEESQYPHLDIVSCRKAFSFREMIDQEEYTTIIG